MDDEFYQAHDGLDANASPRKQVNYGKIHARGASYEQARYNAPLRNANSLTSKLDDICDTFKDTWNNWGMEEQADDDEFPSIDDEEAEDQMMVFEEIVDGDEPEDTEEGFDPEDYTDVDFDEFDTYQHRQLKKVKVKYR